MASEDIQTNIRLPADLKERLVTASDAAGRSLSAEIALRLEESFDMRALVDNLNITGKHTRVELEELRRKYETAKDALRSLERQAAKASAEGSLIRAARAAAERAAEEQRARADALEREVLVARSNVEHLKRSVQQREDVLKMLAGMANQVLEVQREGSSKGRKDLLETLDEVGIFFRAFASDGAFGSKVEEVIEKSGLRAEPAADPPLRKRSRPS